MYRNSDEIEYISGERFDYLQFKILQQYNVKHAYILRNDYLDFSEYGSSKMEESLKIVSLELNLDSQNICIPKQAHTDIIEIVEWKDSNSDFNDLDGLITSKQGKTLITRNADCILFLLYDPIKNVIANVHSGWKGTFKKIIENAIIKMEDTYNCKPEDIICCICPSIRKCHFEVDEDVKDECEKIFSYTKQTKDFIKKGQLVEGKQKYFIDNIKINNILLKDLGIKESNIIDSNMCSFCNNDILYSYRKGDSKRNIALISL